MVLFDIIVAIPLVYLAYKGFSKGFIIEVSTLVGLVMGVYAALHFSHYISNFIMYKLEFYDRNIPFISLLITFIITVMLVIWLGRIVEKLFDILALGIFDKLAGAIFGLAKGALVVGVLIFVMQQMSLEEKFISKESKEKSMLYQPLSSIVPGILKYVDFEEFKLKKEELFNDTQISL
ncbi:MAG: CvpA family protein [Bacteroidales bacterium]|nr:CvpA family protein [Bacteroidales bacterium]